MVKSGLIAGGVMLVLALGVTLVVPYCVPCVALLIGLGAGYLAGVFGKPAEKNAAYKAGAIAGAIGGAGAVLGQMVGAVVNGLLVGPDKAVSMLQNLGLPVNTGYYSPQMYWVSTVGGNCCIGLFSVLLMAGMGVLGGLIWWQTAGSKPAVLPPTPPAPLA